MSIVLAFDLERSGSVENAEVIAIGASVVDETGAELDSLLIKGYFPGKTQFEAAAWDEFWSKHGEQLAAIKADDGDSYLDWEENAIQAFDDFRCKWEKWAADNDKKFALASDNPAMDAGLLNDLYRAHFEKARPLPFTTHTPTYKYRRLRDTTSEIAGLLSVVEPSFDKTHGFSAKLAELYDDALIERVHTHTHNPAHDAYSIAREAQVLSAIREGRVHKRKRGE